MNNLLLAAVIISSPVDVLDGDTWVHRDGTIIRPAGIDAPELGQICTKDGNPWAAGAYVKKALSDFLEGKTVRCELTGVRSYQRHIANCFIGDYSLQAIIVRNGWAFDYPRYSKGQYKVVESLAKIESRGIHAGECEKPWKWRKKNPAK